MGIERCGDRGPAPPVATNSAINPTVTATRTNELDLSNNQDSNSNTINATNANLANNVNNSCKTATHAGCSCNQQLSRTLYPSTPGKNTNSVNSVNNIPVTQINLHKCKIAWDALVACIANHKSPIILATEPYTDSSNSFPSIHRDLVIFRHSNVTEKTRAAVLVHKTLENHCWILDWLCSPDQCVVNLELDGETIIIVSLYMDYLKTAPPSELTPVVKFAETNNLPLIIASDVNGQHFLWGNTKCNERGNKLLEYFESNSLNWHNAGSIPTFCNSRGQKSAIDLSLSNLKGSALIENWKVGMNPSNSDHRYIHFNISIKPPTKKLIRVPRNTNWSYFDNILANSKELEDLRGVNLDTTESLDQAAYILNRAICTAMDKSCPLISVSCKIKKPPWLTPEVESAKRELRHKLMRARSKKLKPEWERYYDRVKAYKKLINKVKRSKWRKFCKDVESMKEKARMNKIIQSNSKSNKLESIKKSDGALTKCPSETLEELCQVHFKSDHNSNLDGSRRDLVDPPTALIEKIYDINRISKAVRSFEPYKAAGPDGIQPIFVQNSWNHIQQIVQNILKSSHRLQHTPLSWRESKGIFIAKPGKTDYQSPKAYRTITLAPTLLKLHEKVILWHMQYDMGLEDATNKMQFGFRKGCSTETALHKLVYQIERRIAKKGFVVGTFLDVEGAFDNISFQSISNAIYASNLDPSTAGWIVNMVTNRYLTISHKSCTKRFKIRRGCPQGGILSPFLWNLVLNSLLNYSPRDIPTQLFAFADDLASLAEGGKDALEVIIQRTNTTIRTIERWCADNGLSISALKTKVVMFTWNYKWSLPGQVLVGGKAMELSAHVKYLGVTIDSKLNFNEHISNIARKATACLMQCQKAVGPTWGLTPNTCKWLFTVVIRPMLSYSAVVWVNALNNRHNAAKLQKVQSLALKIATGAMPKTSTITLNKLTGLPDISDYIRGEAAKGAARLQGYGDWTKEIALTKSTIKSHTTICNDYLHKLNLPKSEWDLTKPMMVLDRNFDTSISDPSELKNMINSIPSNAITCYTDGSKTDDGTGFGYVVTSNSNHLTISEYYAKLPDFCSVYQAEQTAINKVATFLSESRNESIYILSDCQSAINCMKSISMRSKTAINCYHALNNLAVHNSVILCWVKGHDDIWGNEKADELAKLGTVSDITDIGYVPQSLVKRRINQYVLTQSNAVWSLNAPRHSNLVLKCNNNIPKELGFLENNRQDYRNIVQLVTGRAGVNHTLHMMELTDTKECPKCGNEDETISHFLGQCPMYARIRVEKFGEYYMSMTDIFSNFSIKKIAAYARLTKRLEYNRESFRDTGVT